MNNQNKNQHQDGQYRRPQHPVCDDDAGIRPTIDRKQLLSGFAMLAGLSLLMAIALAPRSAEAPAPLPDAAQVRSDTAAALSADCQMVQELTYLPCGHQVTRRQTLTGELAGKGRDALEAAYDAWQITSYASAEVTMTQALDMYCPEHVVLMPDETGMLCIWQNKYGDALARVQELDVALSELADNAQDEARPGKGFDTKEALEKWLESVES